MTGLFQWSSTNFDKLFEKATSHLLLEPDWESVLQICDCIRQGDVQPKYAVSCIKKKLYAQNPHVVLYTLQVLESVMKNCGSPVHVEVASRPFMEELKDLVKSTTNDNVRSRILELIQIWAHAFRNEPKYRAVQDIFNMLKMDGYKLQVLKESDAMFMADTAPDWADGNCCHRCRTQFSVVQRKHHCRNCGQIFCNKCSSRSCPIPHFGIEKDVRVCEACWEKLNKPGGPIKPASPNLESSPQSTAQDVPSSNRKTEQELKEEEDLQLAIALSQSEAEVKEKKKASTKLTYTTFNPPEEIVAAPEKKPNSPSTSENELDRYLNRSYWEQRQQQQKDESSVSSPPTTSPTPSAPSATAPSSEYRSPKASEKMQNGDADELADFLSNLRTTVEIFVNRMKSNSSRGRPIANDTHVQSLFMNITQMHSRLLKHMTEQDDLRAYYERLQDKLNQARDARAALDALREEHRERLRREAEEAERQRQIQMAHKLEIMRKQKQEYLQYQRQLAIQRMQEQEREMQMRQEQQKAQNVQPPYPAPQGQQYPPPHAFVPPGAPGYGPVMQQPPNGVEMGPQQPGYHPVPVPFKQPQMPNEYHQNYNMQVTSIMPSIPLPANLAGAPYPQQRPGPPMGPQMMMHPAHMGVVPQGMAPQLPVSDAMPPPSAAPTAAATAAAPVASTPSAAATRGAAVRSAHSVRLMVRCLGLSRRVEWKRFGPPANNCFLRVLWSGMSSFAKYMKAFRMILHEMCR